MDLSRLPQLFPAFGLKEDAGNAYLATLQLGEARAADIAKRAKLNRSVAYGLLEDLKRKGLLSVKERSGVQHYRVENPALLAKMFSERQADLQELLPMLTMLFSSGGERAPKLRFHADFDGVRAVLEEVLHNPTKTYLVVGSYMEDATEGIGKEYLDKWQKRRIKMKVSHRSLRSKEAEKEAEIWGETFTSRGKTMFRDYRYAPFSIKLPALVYLYDDKVAFVVARFGSAYAAVIESKDAFQSLKELFEAVWTMSREPNIPLT